MTKKMRTKTKWRNRTQKYRDRCLTIKKKTTRLRSFRRGDPRKHRKALKLHLRIDRTTKPALILKVVPTRNEDVASLMTEAKTKCLTWTILTYQMNSM